LASGNDGALVVSGSGDGTIAFWKDDTEEKQLAQQAELAEEMEMSQQLDNLVREKQLGAAFKLAIRLQKVKNSDCVACFQAGLVARLTPFFCALPQPRIMLKLVRGLVEQDDMVCLEALHQTGGVSGFLVSVRACPDVCSFLGQRAGRHQRDVGRAEKGAARHGTWIHLAMEHQFAILWTGSDSFGGDSAGGAAINALRRPGRAAHYRRALRLFRWEIVFLSLCAQAVTPPSAADTFSPTFP
jgi:hypothetical protein